MAARRARQAVQVHFLWATDDPDLFLPERVHFAFGRVLTRALVLLLPTILIAWLAGSREGVVRAGEFVSLFLGLAGAGWVGSFLLWVLADDLRPGDWD
jgi:hypothetical protein